MGDASFSLLFNLLYLFFWLAVIHRTRTEGD